MNGRHCGKFCWQKSAPPSVGSVAVSVCPAKPSYLWFPSVPAICSYSKADTCVIFSEAFAPQVRLNFRNYTTLMFVIFPWLGSACKGSCKLSVTQGESRKGVREPNSYLVWLSDGRLFRRARWAINVDYSSSSSLVASHQPLLPQVQHRAGFFPPLELVQYTPVTVPPFPASLPVVCSTPFRGTASSLAVLPTRSGPVAAPLEGSFALSRISASTQFLQRLRSSPVPGFFWMTRSLVMLVVCVVRR